MELQLLMKTFKQYISEKTSSVDRIRRMSKKIKPTVTKTSDDHDSYFHDRKIGRHQVNMAAHHDTKRNTSKVDFSVDDEGTARTGKVGAKRAKRILNHVASFVHRHAKDMKSKNPDGNHTIQFDALKAGHHHRNPKARANVYRKMTSRVAKKLGMKHSEVDHGHKTTFTLSHQD
jgi:hypothetical protein